MAEDYADRYSIYPAYFTNGTNGLKVFQINSFSIAPGSNIAQIVPGGMIDPQAALIGTADPQIRFSTRDIKAIIGGYGSSGDSPLKGGGTVSISAGYCAKYAYGAAFALQQREICGTFTDDTHILFKCPFGAFVYITSISAEMDNAEGALVDLIALPFLDTGAVYYKDPPIEVDLDDPLAASTLPPPGFNSIYYLGRVLQNTTPLTGVTSIRIDPGMVVTGVRTDGAVYPTRYCITQRRPRLSITTLDPASLNLTAMFGQAIDTQFIIFLYRGLANSTRYALASAEHFQLVCSAGMLAYDDISVSQNDDATTTVTIPVVGVLTAQIDVAT